MNNLKKFQIIRFTPLTNHKKQCILVKSLDFTPERKRLISLYTKNLSMVLLLDMYGSLLSENRRNLMQLYYEEDLSLGEIAQMHNITRQAVHDSIKKSSQLLNETEEKLHLAKKYDVLRKNLEAIEENASLLSESKEKDNIIKLVHSGLENL